MKREKKQAKYIHEQQPVDTEKARPEVHIKPLNEKQRDYLESLFSCSVVIGKGSAGTGKTYLAASVAAKALSDRKIGKIILSRANVPTGKSLGAFPGTVEEKMGPWLMPLTDVLRLHLGPLYDYFIANGIIEFQPVETIRGRDYRNAIVLMDEGQQLTVEELKALVTRIGKDSQLFLLGDSSQRDVHTDGLGWLVNLADKYRLPVAIHEFNSDDIVRSDVCKQFVKAFEQEDKDNG
jgi:phosphate starvation-inducible protein PhoH and related proteins